MAKIPIDEFSRALGLTLLESGGKDYIDIDTTEVTRPGLQLAGFFDYFPHNRVQVFGNVERAYTEKMTSEQQELAFFLRDTLRGGQLQIQPLRDHA